MPSQYSPLLRIELPAPGEQGNTWGDTTNNNLGSLIEGAVAGTSLITTLPATLTELNGAADTSRPMILNVTAPLVANSYIEAPAKSKVYVVYNHTTGGYNLTIKTASSTGVTIPNGKAKVVFYDTQLADYKEAVTAADVFFLTGSITDDAQATTKKYVDDKAGNYVPLNGSAPMTGNLTLPNSTLLVSDPDTYATPKGYVLPKSGGTMTGTLTLSSGSQTAPTGDQAIGKTYADNTYLTKGRKLISGTTGTLTFSQGASTGLSEVILGNGDVTLSVTSGGGAAGVTSFNTRTGAVTLTSSDVTSALTYTPYSNTNPTGYQTAAQVSSAISSGTAGSSNNANALGGVSPSGYLRTDGYQVGSIMTGALILNRGGAENAWVDTVVSGGTRYAVLGSYTSSSVNFAPIVIAQGNATPTPQLVMNATTSGDANFYHNLSCVGTKPFRINHPVVKDKKLYHVAVESPKIDLMYRGKAILVNGRATVNIDAESRLTSGTFKVLTQNAEVVSLNNKNGFTRVRASEVVEGEFTITAEDSACSDSIVWVVMAERADPDIRANRLTDDEGLLIPEQEERDVTFGA